MYRAYAAQRKFAVILGEVHPGSPPELLAVRRYAEYLSSSGEKRLVLTISWTMSWLCVYNFIHDMFQASLRRET